MTARPVTICGLPGPKRHRPHCTARYRLVEGCWCGVDWTELGPERLTARQWRAARRQHQARQRAYRREWPPYAASEDEWVRRNLLWRARVRAAGTDYAAKRLLAERLRDQGAA